ncbi:peptidoglycan DD-metalloendopeptidase family protein [Streptomyces sp. ACA25]|uniref:M23 family metallopeptidase n=1 Tax=Streptomyces sp. ACA25 TaxID=3022596 RepID=UPI002307B03C|nr:peptidoglycan DD-metalloendopeptidase family protein [Streptomyces sp. ACA25]MDB1087184.1 peptidoglycan DD-metalloendopeptidase family protein [Streptomyces sp. ACA25]
MSARGRHRRPAKSRISRFSLMLTAGSAGVAMPFMVAGSAQAAPAPVQSTAVTPAGATTLSAPALGVSQGVVQTGAPASHSGKSKAAKSSRATSGDQEAAHTVVSGDTLSRIATAHEVQGGWEGLYERNREVVGSNPNLIFPGQKLSLSSGQAAQAPAPAEKQAAPKAPKTEQPAAPKAEPKAEKSSGKHAAPKAEKKAEPKAAPRAEKPAEKKAAPAAQAAAPAASGFSVPVHAAPSTRYGMAGNLWSSGYHTGADFAASTGTKVMAVSTGTVVSAGWAGAYGNEVVIRHSDGRYSQYAHLSALSVSSGQSVQAGQQIGLVGSTGNSTGPHLHFEVRTGPGYGSDIDPLAYLRANGVSL